MSRHEVEGQRLRRELGELTQQALAVLQGRPPPPRAQQQQRTPNYDAKLNDALERIRWYQAEIARLRQELEGRKRVNVMGREEDRDPMELLNLIAERRAVLQELSKETASLDQIAVMQHRAEAAHNSMTPAVEERLRRLKDDVQ